MRTKCLAAALALTLLGACAHDTHDARDSHDPGPGTTRPAEASGATAFAGLERRYRARLGVVLTDTGTGRTVAYRADERFAHASTFKLLAAGVILERHDDLDRVVHYRREDVLDYAPITAKHRAMRLRDLISAALRYSDNTAANLLLERLGGPAGLQRALRRDGDATTRTDRAEPNLNEARRGDVRDTSTPRALAGDVRRFVLADALSPADRSLLTGWLRANTTGAKFIRAGVPKGWTVGDKTGNGGYGTRNDIGVVWPAGGRPPIVVAVLSDRGAEDAASDDALIADATRAGLAALVPAGG
jgi:beta-lactamase class A